MRVVYIKLIGWVMLIAYLSQTPIAFNPLWVVVYVVVSIVITVVYILVIKPLFQFVAPARIDNSFGPHDELLFHPKNAPVVESMSKRPLRALLLVPGETGFFFVPVAIVGVTWWSAILVGFIFGLFHYRTYAIDHCAVKALTAFINCYFILPYGVLHMVAGHLVVDAIAIGTFWMMTSADERRAASSTTEVERERSAGDAP